MLRGEQIIHIGLVITAATLLASNCGLAHEATAFLMGMGCSLSLVGAGKRFAEERKQT